MLNGVKNKIKETRERTERFIDKHKFEIGVGVGIASIVGTKMLYNKIFETQRREIQVYNGDFSKNGLIDFALGLIEVDRFGGEHTSERQTLRFSANDKEFLFTQIESAIETTKRLRETVV